LVAAGLKAKRPPIEAASVKFQSENHLADGDTQIATYLVNLYRALGGDGNSQMSLWHAATLMP